MARSVFFGLLVLAILVAGLPRQATKLSQQQLVRQKQHWVAPPTDYWFTQRLDHFNPSAATQTFPQRYWMNDTFADGNSMLLAFAGEAPLQDFYGISGNILADIAKENKMLFIYIEHRFYGDSVPNNDSSVGNLAYLTTSQALEDYAYFIQWATSGGLKLKPNAKIITFGCSYSGMLSAFFRQKYNWLTAGAIAGSAPVLAQLNFEGYDNTVKSVLASQPGCDTIVSKAFESISLIYKNQGMPLPAWLSLAHLD